MDVRNTLALQAYTQTPRAEPVAPADTTQGDAFGQVVADMANTMAQGEHLARQAMTSGADAHALVTALAQTELAVETAVTVRDRVVEAYQEILRMPV